MNPHRVIRSYPGCKINHEKSNLDSLELRTVWKFLHRENLNDSHDSLIDTNAQSSIILHDYFVPYINRTKSIQTIGKMFRTKEVNDRKKKMEPL